MGSWKPKVKTIKGRRCPDILKGSRGQVGQRVNEQPQRTTLWLCSTRDEGNREAGSELVRGTRVKHSPEMARQGHGDRDMPWGQGYCPVDGTGRMGSPSLLQLRWGRYRESWDEMGSWAISRGEKVWGRGGGGQGH